MTACAGQAAGGAALFAVGAAGTVATLGYSNTTKQMADDGYRNAQHGAGKLCVDAAKLAMAPVAYYAAGAALIGDAAMVVGLAGAAAKVWTWQYTADEARAKMRIHGLPKVEEPPQLSLVELAELACDVYEDESLLSKVAPRNEFYRTGRRLENKKLAELTDIEDVEVYTPVMVYRHRKLALAVIAIRGTCSENYSLLLDLYSIVGSSYPGEMIIGINDLVKEEQRAGNQVMVTGHSLGGYLAEIAATEFHLGGAGFMAPGPGEHNGPHDVKRWYCTINHEGDNIGNTLMPSAHQGEPVYIEDGGVVHRSCHKIMDMVTYMKRRPNWKTRDIEQYLTNERRASPYYSMGLKTMRSYRDSTGEPLHAQWMWGDASFIGHWLASANPARWSGKYSMAWIKVQLESQTDDDKKRPVDMILYRQRPDGSGEDSESVTFASATKAIAGLHKIMEAHNQGHPMQSMEKTAKI